MGSFVLQVACLVFFFFIFSMHNIPVGTTLSIYGVLMYLTLNRQKKLLTLRFCTSLVSVPPGHHSG